MLVKGSARSPEEWVLHAPSICFEEERLGLSVEVGDDLAQVAACRIAARRLQDIAMAFDRLSQVEAGDMSGQASERS